MKKLLLASIFFALTAAAAQAQVNLDVDLGGRPGYAHQPYYNNWGRDHHHRGDWHDYRRDDHRDDHRR